MSGARSSGATDGQSAPRPGQDVVGLGHSHRSASGGLSTTGAPNHPQAHRHDWRLISGGGCTRMLSKSCPEPRAVAQTQLASNTRSGNAHALMHRKQHMVPWACSANLLQKRVALARGFSALQDAVRAQTIAQRAAGPQRRPGPQHALKVGGMLGASWGKPLSPLLIHRGYWQ